jgi:poly(A) polymerase
VCALIEIEPRVLPRADHPISRSDISENTLKVLYRLHKAGYRAFLVGGGVRDLMLGRRPKDFDVATDAHPGEIRSLFRNSRIIGRRFRLVHVFFRGEVVEVSTFRREPDPDEQERDGEEEGDLLITSDNTYGTPLEDAFRRDFTVNALFYDIADFSVVDYVGGIDDLEAQLIRAIGDPDVRFQEDPVRMLRACEFAGRLGFGIEAGTQEAIHRQRRLIEKASTARLTEEVQQLLRCGHAGRALQWMLDLGLLEIFLPEAYAMVAAGERGLGDFGRLLPAIDEGVRAGREHGEPALLAAVLLPSVLLRRYDVEAVDQRPMSRTALAALVGETVAPFAARFALSRERAQHVERTLTGFLRLCEPGGTEATRARLARRPYFDDALALFALMVEATDDGHEALAAWRAAAARQGRDDTEERVVGGGGREAADGERPRRRRRRRGRRRG